jgi:hypothetical protein
VQTLRVIRVAIDIVVLVLLVVFVPQYADGRETGRGDLDGRFDRGPYGRVDEDPYEFVCLVSVKA